MSTHRRSLLERFRENVCPEPNSGCFLWLGHFGSDGYGRIGLGGREGRDMRANRVAWELAHGPIPAGMFVLHRCDNPACVNTAHLFLGTQKDNIQDMVSKGRHHYQARTMCKRGHVLSETGYYYSGGQRKCRLCHRHHVSRYMERLRYRVEEAA